jgi:ribosome biogenesis protein UTP30
MAVTATSGGEKGDVKVKKTQLQKAVKALKQLVAKRSANANPLFGANSETMNVIFTLSTVPEKRRMKPMLIKLPHPMYDGKSEICFLAKDPQKQYKEILMRTNPVPGITKVIGLEKLKKNYKDVESKRALADAFDLFLCDSRIVEMMPKVLGTIFYKKKLKPPVPVRMHWQDPAPALQNAINGTTLRVPSGPCVGVRFGKCGMEEDQLVANAGAVISFVTKYLAWNPVQTISVQATDSPALPIWRRAPPPGELVNMKKLHSDAASSSASDTGVSGESETESVLATELSDAGETMSARDTVSEIDTDHLSMSELETGSELDSEAGDVDEKVTTKEKLPLVQGLKGKKRRLNTSAKAKSPELKPAKAKSPEVKPMPPPAQKTKKRKTA